MGKVIAFLLTSDFAKSSKGFLNIGNITDPIIHDSEQNIERYCHLEFFLEVLTEKKSNSKNATSTEATLAIRSRRKGPTEIRILKSLKY